MGQKQESSLYDNDNEDYASEYAYDDDVDNSLMKDPSFWTDFETKLTTIPQIYSDFMKENQTQIEEIGKIIEATISEEHWHQLLSIVESLTDIMKDQSYETKEELFLL